MILHSFFYSFPPFNSFCLCNSFKILIQSFIGNIKIATIIISIF
nr:MAG TPA: hypothetical protein [Bacteriophage sp.]